MNIEEVWKPINGYEGYYEISNYGRVKTVKRTVLSGDHHRTVPEKIRRPNIMKDYHCVALMKDSETKVFRVHRLVAEAFISKQPGPEYQINHKDGNKANNFVDNLEWVTPSENTRHAHRMGLVKPQSEQRRQSLSKRLRRQWADPEYRKKQSKNMCSIWSNPETRRQRTEQITAGIHLSQSERYLKNRKDDT